MPTVQVERIGSEEKDEKDEDGKVVGTATVIDYDKAIETFVAGIALAVAADSWDLQTQLEERRQCTCTIVPLASPLQAPPSHQM